MSLKLTFLVIKMSFVALQNSTCVKQSLSPAQVPREICEYPLYHDATFQNYWFGKKKWLIEALDHSKFCESMSSSKFKCLCRGRWSVCSSMFSINLSSTQFWWYCFSFFYFLSSHIFVKPQKNFNRLFRLCTSNPKKCIWTRICIFITVLVANKFCICTQTLS